MAEKKTEQKEKPLEREYVIPLRERYRKVPRYRKAEKAVKTIKEFLARHMKVYDRDLSKVRVDRYVNEFIWSRGIKNPPHKVKIKAVKEGEIVRAELVDYPDKIKYRKAREEKREAKGEEVAKKKSEEKKPEQEVGESGKENKETSEGEKSESSGSDKAEEKNEEKPKEVKEDQKPEESEEKKDVEGTKKKSTQKTTKKTAKKATKKATKNAEKPKGEEKDKK